MLTRILLAFLQALPQAVAAATVAFVVVRYLIARRGAALARV